MSVFPQNQLATAPYGAQQPQALVATPASSAPGMVQSPYQQPVSYPVANQAPQAPTPVQQTVPAAPTYGQPFFPFPPQTAPAPVAPVQQPQVQGANPTQPAQPTPAPGAAPVPAPTAPPAQPAPMGNQPAPTPLGTPTTTFQGPLTEANLLDKSPEWMADNWKQVAPLLR